jgi:hypothetical protein
MADKMMIFSDASVRAREFIISTYHNLPNVLLVTSLLLGAIQGNLSMLWVAIGMILNSLAVISLQELLGLLFPMWKQVHQPGSKTCSISQDTLGPPTTIVAPSYWFASTTYFVVFISEKEFIAVLIGVHSQVHAQRQAFESRHHSWYAQHGVGIFRCLSQVCRSASCSCTY